MQMKNNKGVTLIAAIVTIITLGIILSITIVYGMASLDRVQNNRMKSDILMIQQAVVQQYGFAQTKNALGKVAIPIVVDTEMEEDQDRPKELYGIRISDVRTLKELGFKTYLINYSINYESQTDLTYEQYYYELTSEDLHKLGIDENNSTYQHNYRYIVNYSTGEVFDIENKTYKQSNVKNKPSIYLPGTDSKIENNENYVFNDE